MKHPSAPQPGKAMLLLVLFLAAVFALSLALAIHTEKAASTPVEPILPVARAAGDPAELVLTAFRSETDREPVHLLLIGHDSREDGSAARSDAMILCSFLPDRKQLMLTSFLRDLYVEIPGHGADRLNAAYAFGGMALLRETLETNFGIPVDGCIEVDFSQFAGAVDALGGVTVNLRQDEAESVNSTVPGGLTAGDHLLTGQQALAYTRIRNLDEDGDFSRTRRQRTVLTALLDRFRSAGLKELLSLSGEVLPMLSSDTGSKELLSLALRVFPLLPEARIVSQRIPAEGSFTYANIRGMEVLVTDLEEARKLLDTSLSGPKIS